jgi:tetratricopeptide (TPR) repeat protein
MTQDIALTLAAAQQKFVGGQLDEAAALLNGVLAAQPDHGEALEGLGYIAAKSGDYARAADLVTRALQVMPASRDQIYWAAEVCQLADRHDEAAALFERCLAQGPDHPPYLHGAALSLAKLGEHERALAMFERLLARNPSLFQVHYNRGNLLGTMGRYDEEIAAYRQAIALKPDFVRAHVNLGVALRDLHRFDEAMQQFKKAVTLDANDAGARTNRAQTNLLRGEFEHGWREYEWRWRDGSQSLEFDAALLWTGQQPLDGKTVLINREQGLGDTLQFVRYVGRLADAGARVVLRVQDVLVPLLQDYPGVAQLIGDSDAVPAFDYHVPLLSLPFAFRMRAADIPATVPYLRADPGRLAQWDDVFEARSATGVPRVGVVWSGSRGHLNDHNRSLKLAQLAPLFDANAAFVSLQKDVRDCDRDTLAQHVRLRDVSDRLVTFADTAALVSRLDVVISVDTSVAHLAGALGKPVWIALPFTPDWRWQLERSDSPWYPQARLFRQTVRGDWSNVLSDLENALNAWPALPGNP